MDNINEIVEKLFSKDPLDENSIKLELDEESSFIALEDFENYIFELLFLISLGGIEYLFGHRNILQLTEKDFNLVNRYIKSVGYKIIIKTNDLPETPWELMSLDIPIRSYKISFESNS
jgi:phage FluMu protein gp41